MKKSIQSYFPIKNIYNGLIETKDKRICKILEILPINFSLKSISEQKNILYQYKNFLNTCNFDMQILVQSRRKDLDKHVEKIRENIKRESNFKITKLMNEYINMVNNEVVKSAITKRFFIIFSSDKIGKEMTKEQAIEVLHERTLKIKTSLAICGNDVKDFEKNNKELINIIYTYLNPITSEIQNFKEFDYEYKN